MDNVTHSLFGYALGRATARGLKAEPGGPLERALVAGSVLASNAPDLDFISGFIGDDRQLIYLLEHRGFTHTLVFAAILGVLVGLGCAAALRIRGARERLAVCGLGAFASFFHIGFDFLNDYGVHPFFPFDNRWYYGDSVFIIEPLLLAVLLPLPMFFALTRTGRGVSIALAVAMLALVWAAGATIASAVLTTVVLAIACFAQLRLRARAAPALVACALVVGMFALGSRRAEAEVAAALHGDVPTERVLDIDSVPVPANPACYRIIALTIDREGTYRARLGRAGLFGAGESCAVLPSEPSAPLVAADIDGTPAVQFDRLFAAPAVELADLAKTQCDAEAMLRFVRVPFWASHPDGALLGDLRYDRGPSLEFAERLLTGICNRGRVGLSPWVPPRADLLALPPD